MPPPPIVENVLGDQQRFLRVVQESLQVKRHFQLFMWLQGELQHFIPHEILIAAWGDFSLGLIHYDIVSALPGVRTSDLSGDDISPFLRRLFVRWLEQGMVPFSLVSETDLAVEELSRNGRLAPTMIGMRSALVHGIRDERGRHDCLYIALHSDHIPFECGKMLEMFLPYIDTALRQVSHLPTQCPAEEIEQPEEIFDSSLSTRELEIMEWVSRGKTNHEIGIILDISTFTVKNHLQRVFRKLDVTNRAQAVSAFKKMNNKLRRA